MKKMFFLVLSFAICIFGLAGCDAQFTVNKNNSVDGELKIDEESLHEYMDENEAEIENINNNRQANSFFDELDINADIDVTYSKLKKGTYSLNVKITPTNNLKDAFKDGLAIGEFVDVLELYGDDDWAQVIEDMESEVEDNELYLLDNTGNIISKNQIAKKINKKIVNNYKCAYINFTLGNTIWEFPDPIYLVITEDETNVEFINKNKVEIQNGEDVLIVYGNNSSISILTIFGLFILGFVGYFLIKLLIKPSYFY